MVMPGGSHAVNQVSVIHNLIGTQRQTPLAGFSARSGGDYSGASQLFGKLNRYGTDTARTTDNQQRLFSIVMTGYTKAVKQPLPGIDRGQRQRSGFSTGKARRCSAENPLMYQLKYAVDTNR